MQRSKLMLAGALSALLFGVAGLMASADPATRGEGDIVIAADDTPPGDAATDEGSAGSAKMGEDPGTHTGADQGATPENDTQKIDQPARRSETTTNPPDNGVSSDGNDK